VEPKVGSFPYESCCEESRQLQPLSLHGAALQSLAGPEAIAVTGLPSRLGWDLQWYLEVAWMWPSPATLLGPPGLAGSTGWGCLGMVGIELPDTLRLTGAAHSIPVPGQVAF